MSTKTDWPVEYGHFPFDEVTSTLDVAREHAGQFPNPTWFTAKRQSAARGRRGRAWIEPHGNFAAALSLPLTDPSQAALRSFVAGLALADALEICIGSEKDVGLKWPNDVLLAGGKVAGILLEGLTHQNRVWGVAIGIGVNLAAAPPVSAVEPQAVPPVALADFADTVSPDDFLNALAPAFARWEGTLRQHGFSVVRTEWLSRAARLGETITARTGRETITGQFQTIDEMGHLVLETATGARNIAAADVFF